MKLSVRFQAWLILGSFFGMALLLQPYRWLPNVERPAGELIPHPDFIAFYMAGLLIREAPSALYDENRQASVQAKITNHKVSPSGPEFLPFGYPAVTALLYLPFTVFPYSAAFITALGVNIFLCGLALGILSDRLGLSDQAASLLVLCVASSLPAYQALSNGQLSFLVFLLYVLIVVDTLKQSARAGVWAGLLMVKPTLMPVVLLWMAMRRQWKSLAYATITGSALLLISVLMIGAEGVSGYFEVSGKMARGEYLTVNILRMPNLRSLVHLLGFGDGLWIILTVGVLTLLYFRSRDLSEASCAPMLLAVMLTAPHIHYQDLNLFWIALALALRQWRLNAASRWALLGITLLSTALIYTTTKNSIDLPIASVPFLALFLFWQRNPSTGFAETA
jgi:hypothetical protein